jgi:hypothetical protein
MTKSHGHHNALLAGKITAIHNMFAPKKTGLLCSQCCQDGKWTTAATHLYTVHTVQHCFFVLPYSIEQFEYNEYVGACMKKHCQHKKSDNS